MLTVFSFSKSLQNPPDGCNCVIAVRTVNGFEAVRSAGKGKGSSYKTIAFAFYYAQYSFYSVQHANYLMSDFDKLERAIPFSSSNSAVYLALALLHNLLFPVLI